MISFLRKLAWLRDRRRKEAELEEELQFHLDEEAEQRQSEGLSNEQARTAARRDLGNVALVREDARAEWGWTTLEQFGQDLRYAFRTMASNRLFTSLAVLSLALGIGANTAIYSFMDWILMRSLPVEDPDSLVVMNWRAKAPRRRGDGKVWHAMSGSIFREGKTGVASGIFPFPSFELFQKKGDSLFSSVFGFCPAGSLTLTTNGYSDLTRSEFVTGDFFRGLGVPPGAGRLLSAGDDVAGAPAVAVLSAGLAERRFGSPQAALGRPVLINKVPFQVVGVTPTDFFGVNPAFVPDLYVPMQASRLLESDPMLAPGAKFLNKNYYWLEIMARLGPGVTLEQAQAALATPFHNWVESTATTDDARANLPQLALREGARGLNELRREFSKPLYVLMLLVALILAIACANIANLLLARAETRRREIALRLSIGAGRGRIVRQLLTESVVLSSLGGILGVLFAVWGIRFLSLLLAGGQSSGFVPRAELNWSVLAVAAALSLLTGVVFGLAPAFQATRVDVLPALKEIRANRTPSRLRFKLSHALVASQIAMSLVLLFAAGLFVRTLSNLQSVNVGFRRENLLLFQLNAGQAGHKGEEMVRFFAGLRDRFSTIPGVTSVSLSNSGGLFEAGFSLGRIQVGGRPAKEYRLLFVGPDFFRTMGIPVLAGREIGAGDSIGAPQVAIVSELFATTNLETENPLGLRLTMEKPDPRDAEIVGVAKDARYGGVKRDLPPVVYMPYDQGPLKFVDEMTYVVHTTGDPMSYLKTIHEMVRQADPLIPVANVITQETQIEQAIHQEIAFAKLCSAFALLALVIACVGLYGTVAYNVARRTNEIGIRIALGAQGATVLMRVLREVFLQTTIGLAISIPVVLGWSSLLESLVYGMKPSDPPTVIMAALTLLAAALAAGYVPARKASRIDPMAALRHE